MAALGLLLLISGIVMTALKQMMMTQGTVSNRTEMHSSVRSATEVLQQEIGQAGRVALPGQVTLPTGVTLPAQVTLTSAVTLTGSVTVDVSSTAGMFAGEQLLKIGRAHV